MKNARKTEQPAAGSGRLFTADDYAYLGRVMADAYEHARRRGGAAADDSPKPSSADKTAFDGSALLALAARWLVAADEEDRLASCAMAAERMLSHSLHSGRADSLRACAEEVRRAAEANDPSSPTKPA